MVDNEINVQPETVAALKKWAQAASKVAGERDALILAAHQAHLNNTDIAKFLDVSLPTVIRVLAAQGVPDDESEE